MADMHTPLLPCPFCGEAPGDVVDATKFAGVYRIVHRCKVVPPFVLEGATTAQLRDAWNRRAPSQDAETIKALREQIATKDAALHSADYALSNLIEAFKFDDDDSSDAPCQFHELCGEGACEECGCLKDKRDAVRAALAGSAS